MNYWLFILPLIGAFIGWVITVIAIKLLFHPLKPIKIFGISFQGFFPKKQKMFAEKLGKLVGSFFSFGEIEKKITNPENVKKLMPMIEDHIDIFLRKKLAQEMPMISMFIGDKTIIQLKTVFTAELEILFPQIMSSYIGNLQAELDFEKMVTEKIAELKIEKLELVLNSTMNKELRFIKISGAVLGFIIGLIQLLLICLQ